MKTVRLFTLLFCLTPTLALAHEAITPSSIKDKPLEKVSPNIYVVHGDHDLPNPQNRGFMNNPAAIITSKGVVIVDPGGSAEVGKEMLKKVRKISKKPVIAVFNTHVHGDHWLGNYGISQVYPKVPIYAHVRTIERLHAGEAQVWLTRFMGMTQGAIAGTQIVIPTKGLKGGETITLGDTILRIRYAGPAHSDSDITIEVVHDKALFSGDIVLNKIIPNGAVPQDANYQGAIIAVKNMLDTPATLFIPGHGRSGGRELPEAMLRYLQTLHGAVRKYYKQGLSAADMKDPVMKDLQEFKDWADFNELGRIITYVYQQVERDEF